MKDVSLVTANTAQVVARNFRGANRLIDAEPFSRPTDSGNRPDDLRLRSALKRAAERDLAPQTLIDAIRTKIRNTDESR